MRDARADFPRSKAKNELTFSSQLFFTSPVSQLPPRLNRMVYGKPAEEERVLRTTIAWSKDVGNNPTTEGFIEFGHC